MATKQAKPPAGNTPWVNPDGTPSQVFLQYVNQTDTLIALLAAGGIGPLPNATSDANAAAAGVKVGGLYRNGNAVQIRLA